MESDRRNYPPGVDFFHTGVRRRKYKLGLPADLLRLTEFILPPPHPSVKEIHPRGVIPTTKSTASRANGCVCMLAYGYSCVLTFAGF